MNDKDSWFDLYWDVLGEMGQSLRLGRVAELFARGASLEALLQKTGLDHAALLGALFSARDQQLLHDLIANAPIQRLQDIVDYHSSPEEAAATAMRAGIRTLVLTHYLPAFPSGGGEEWRTLAAAHFTGRIELGDDLHQVEVPSR